MKRRTFLGTVAAGAGVLAAPRLGRGTAASTLKFVPAQDLALLDPIQSPSGSTIMHSCLVFDTLYGLDESYKAQPQMVEGHVIEDDGKTWKLALRDGLKFHNGEPVRARDVVASLQRWGKRDTFGQTLFSVTDELSAPSDKVVQFRLKKPFPMIPDALGKIGAFFAIIVPEHLAQTEPTKGMPEIIGSGPYRYVPGERVQGSLNVYAKFTDYCAAQLGHAELPRRTEDRALRPRRMAHDSGPRDGDRGVAGGRGGLVGPGDRRHTAAAAQEPQHRGQRAFHRRVVWHAAAKPDAATVQQPGGPARGDGRDQSVRLHDRGRR